MPRQRKFKRSMGSGPGTRTRGAQTRAQESETLKFDEEMKKLRFICATREVLKKNGYKVVKRCLSFQLKKEVGGFMDLAKSEPELYGELGSVEWKRGLLSYINLPTIISWDDVSEWLKNPDLKGFFKGKSSKLFTPGDIRFIPVKRASTCEDGTEHLHKKPTLKLGIVKLNKCDAHPPQQPAVNNSMITVDDNETCLRESETPTFGAKVMASVELAVDDDSATISKEKIGLGCMQPAVVIAQNEEVPTQDEASPSPCVAEERGTQIQSIEERVSQATEVNGTWIHSLEYYRTYGQLDVSGLVTEVVQVLEGDDTNRNEVCVVANTDSPLPSSPHEQLPAEATETAQNSETDELEITTEAATTSNENEEGAITVSKNEEPEIPEPIPSCFTQTTAADLDHEELYQNCLAKAIAWLNFNNKDKDPADEPVPTKCPICIRHRRHFDTIQFILQQLDTRIVMLYSSEQHLDCDRINKECFDLTADLNILGNYFVESQGACPSCGGNNVQ
ncbi:unnamed protein product [Orchesella dallaii]|uniref:Uncharacterized protein n=1 Tax=Orchesella dallaii TaxID=48710 RepID=A0ABP1RBY1_9HEXA